MSTRVVHVEVCLLGPRSCRLNIEDVSSALVAGCIKARLHLNVRVASLRDHERARLLDQLMPVRDFCF